MQIVDIDDQYTENGIQGMLCCSHLGILKLITIQIQLVSYFK